MSWNQEKEIKKKCNEWISNPLKNPETGMPIKRNGPTFFFWKKKCIEYGIKPAIKSPSRGGKMSFESCRMWKENPTINPITNRKIKMGGDLYKKIEKQCKNISNPGIILLGEYVAPNDKGLVPCKNDSDTFYILRKYENRNVYGPLNKYFRSATTWIYFKDTWDYRNGHYKPVFLGLKEPARKKENTIGSIRGPGGQRTKLDLDSIIDYFTS